LIVFWHWQHKINYTSGFEKMSGKEWGFWGKKLHDADQISRILFIDLLNHIQIKLGISNVEFEEKYRMHTHNTSNTSIQLHEVIELVDMAYQKWGQADQQIYATVRAFLRLF